MKNWPYPTLFAHRGGGTLAPENTLAAIRTGLEHSYAAVEFDVKLSADNIALLRQALRKARRGAQSLSCTRMSASFQST